MEPVVPATSAGPRRVVLTGSESVGKSQLALALADHYGARVVPEFVRTYVSEKGAPLDFRDHGPIAHGQMKLEDHAIELARTHGESLVLHDTDLVSTVVYCHHYFGRCPEFIEEAAAARRADLYLLLDIDVPWVADGVRDREHQREEMQAMFRDTLTRLGMNVRELRGDWDTRFAEAVHAIDALRGGGGGGGGGGRS